MKGKQTRLALPVRAEVASSPCYALLAELRLRAVEAAWAGARRPDAKPGSVRVGRTRGAK